LTTRTERQVDLHLSILEREGHAAPSGAAVLDFGCGDGAVVEALGDRGLDAWGCDVVLERETARLRLIAERPYALPFADASFDLVVSDQVFEHVQDQDAAFSEISRVMRSSAASLHVFPPRWRLREAHTYVPFGGAVRRRGWLDLWARAGVRNEFQQDLPAQEVARLNDQFLTAHTNYPSRRALRNTAHRYFHDVRFVEAALIGCAPGRIRKLAPVAPVLAGAYSGLRSRALLLARPRAASTAARYASRYASVTASHE
jgi:SAM-dependent methyltransferase